jgi:hypothetical protein
VVSRYLKYAGIAVLAINAWLLSCFAFLTVFWRFRDVMNQSPLMFQDFMRYYCCGKIALSDQRTLAYDKQVQFTQMEGALRQFYSGPLPSDYHIPFDYPPLVHVLMMPLALLPVQVAFVCWLTISISTVCLGIYSCLELPSKRQTLVWVLVLATCILTWRTLSMGQMSWLLFGLTGLYLGSILKKRNVLCAVFLTLICAIKPQYMPFLVMPLLVQRNWKALGSFVVSGLLALGITCAVMTPNVVFNYPSVLMHVESSDPYYVSMVCLRALIALAVSGTALKVITLAVLVTGLASVAALWKWAAKDISRQRWAAALTIVIALMSSPHAHNFDALLVFLSGVLTLPSLNPELISKWSDALQKTWALLLLSFVPLSWLLLKGLADAPPGAQTGAFVLFFTAMIAVGVATMRKQAATRVSAEATT